MKIKKILTIFGIFIFLFSSFIWLINQAGATTIGPNNPSTNQNGSSIGTVNWTNLDNDKTSNDKYATTQGMDDGDTTVYLKATNFGFSIPAGVIIDGVSVNVERKASDTSFFDNAIRIVKGGMIGVTDKSSGNAWPTNDGTITYGGASDLWGETWTNTDINSVNFGFAISVKKVGGNNNKKPSIDWINITVTYHIPLPTVVISAEPTTITLGQPLTLTWSSTNAISCSASGDWSGSKLTNGTENITPDSSGTKNYTLTCSGSGGSASNVATVIVNELLPPTVPSADLSITKSDSPDPIIAGDTLTYIITVTNNGPDDAENVMVSDTLPLALTSPSLTSSQGTCIVFPCNLGIITSNHSASITIISPTDSNIIGTITNIASVLSDKEDPVTSNNVSIQDTIASSSTLPLPQPSLSEGVRAQPTTVVFSGRAFPNAKIFVVDRDIRFETTINQNIVADDDGTFQVNFVGISHGLHNFSLLVKDQDNRITQTKFFSMDILAYGLVVKNILVPPTTGFLQRMVSRGQPAIVIGNASPDNSIILEIDNIIKKEAKVEEDGSYKVAVDTSILEFGTHSVRVKQVDASQNRESDYSPTNTFVVSHLTLPKADLSGDGLVDIKDWSMFLSNWVSKDESQKKIIDFNDDGKINISDFSIFVRAIKKMK